MILIQTLKVFQLYQLSFYGCQIELVIGLIDCIFIIILNLHVQNYDSNFNGGSSQQRRATDSSRDLPRIVENINRSFIKLIKPNQLYYSFLYIPFQNLYPVMVSSKNSNIIEDQQTIRTIYKILCSICEEIKHEESVQKHSIDIILTIDGAISMNS